MRNSYPRLKDYLQQSPGSADPLAFLLELNLACAVKEKAGEKVTPPGLPLPEKEHATFITQDCIQPSNI